MPYTATVTVNNIVLPDGFLHQAGDVVTLSDDAYAQMGPTLRAAVLSGITPVPTGGGGSSYRGPYSSGTAYAVGDLVTAHSEAFVATAATTGNDPMISTALISGTPATIDSGDGASYEMGVKFTVARALLLTGVSFYKASMNTIAHTVTLWQLAANSIFQQVDQAVSSGETSSGMQTVPLQAYLEPGTTYMVSVSMRNYSLTQHVFDGAVTVGSVTAPAGAGMYNTIPGHAPNTTPGTNTSYWVTPVWNELDTAHWQTLGEYQLAPVGMPSATESAASYVAAQIGANGGLAGLDGSGKLITGQLPAAVLQAANNLSDVSSAATSRTNLGLGTSATRAVGTVTGTVAAGDDSRIAGALQAANNLSDVGSAATARSSLGLGTAAVKTVNTTAGTIAALGTQAAGASGQVPDAAHVHPMPRLDQVGAPTAPVALNSQKITGLANGSASSDAATFGQLPVNPLLSANNLSDLASAPTARTNLGLGGAAVLAVGTGAGTVAAGNDTRIAGALQAANNLVDLVNAATARTNLGLGGAAVLSVGTTTGTVAAGDDSRLTASLRVAAPSGDVTGATDITAINAAIASANTFGGNAVLLQTGTYWVNAPVILRSGVVLRGAAPEATILMLANGANCDVVQSLNFSTLSLTGASTWQVSGVWNCGVADLAIDGNRANQTGASWGVRIFGYNFNLNNLNVRSCYTDGLWTEWGPLSSDAPATTDGSESTVNNVKSHHNGRHGWMHLGPSDCRFDKVMAFKNNQASGTTSIGFWGLQDRYSNVLSTDSTMNGTAASGFTGTFNLNSATATDLYAGTGTLTVTTSTGTATMTYTGKTTASFTGCTVTSGSGNFQTGNSVVNSTSKFTTNGLQMTACHAWSNDHTWACVLDGQTSVANSHWEGARYGQLLIRNSANVAGGFVYDFSPIATGCGIQLGDDGTTPGLPITTALAANACHINTRVSSILNDTARRASVRWVSATQSNIQVHNVTKTTGTYASTVASASNNVDISTWTGSGTLTVASTNQIPDGAGTLTVATSNGTFTCTYTGNNVTVGANRTSGTQFTGLTATGSPPGGSLLSTGGAVALVGIGTVAYTGTVDGGSRLALQSAGPTTAISTAASYVQEFGPRRFDLGSAANGFLLRTNGTDQLNLNTASKQLQLPNGQTIILYSDNYTTQLLKLDGTTGVVTGPTRGGKGTLFPGASWVPGDHGLVTWNGDPIYANANSVVATAGTVYHIRVHCPVVFTATNVLLYVVTAGSGLTSGQCFAGLCAPGGTMIASTADLSSGATSFASGGSYTFPLSGGPYTNLAAGDYTVCFFFNGTTGPALLRFGNVAGNAPNIGLGNGTYRHFTDSTNTGRTTTFPTNKGTESASAFAWFAGIN